MPGGDFCCIVGCSACKKKNKHLSFHGLPKKGANDTWRALLIKTINRADKSFNPDKAKICSRHFTDECFNLGKL